MTDERCYAAIGTVRTGHLYCGNRAKTVDENGRPVCGRHANGRLLLGWYGDKGRYPNGTGGDWKFARGESR